MTPKLAAVLFFLQGAWELKWPGRQFLRPSSIAVALAIYFIVTLTSLTGVQHVGIVQHVALTFLFTIGAVFLLKQPVERGIGWLGAAFVLRASLTFVEAVAYTSQIFTPHALQETASWFLAAHSSFDSGAAWAIALGCVLALSARDQQELRHTNEELLSAQANLRRLIERDPLTSLANRRSLDDVFEKVRSKGAMLLFLDIDEFKEINDVHGHGVGDRCLQRFARALVESFRPEDAIVRYGGDEFIVVASGLTEEGASARVESVRRILDDVPESAPEIRFSYGAAELYPEASPDEALEAADAAMYRSKVDRRPRLGALPEADASTTH